MYLTNLRKHHAAFGQQAVILRAAVTAWRNPERRACHQGRGATMSDLFEVGVFNEAVRAALNEGDHHKQLKDEWADIHYFEVTAADAEVAQAEIARRYPPARGFVLASVVKLR
jgi:hypothetical protein